MPRIIEYPEVLKKLTAQGLVCLYPNGGAFGFPRSQRSHIRGWIGPVDPTIRPDMLARTRPVNPPLEHNLAESAALAWTKFLPGPVWIMPASHWSFELSHGSGQWLKESIENLTLDSAPLLNRTDAAAIEFSSGETSLFRGLVEKLLQNLVASDFCLAFPGHATVCTLHHHKQLWWVTASDSVLAGLDSIVHNQNCA